VLSKARGAIACGVTRVRRRRGYGAVAAVAPFCVALICASCGGSDAAGNRSASNSSPTTTSTNPQSAAVVAAYRAEQAAFEGALQRADPNSPMLAQTMTGSQLTAVRRALVADQANGIVGRGTTRLNPKVVSIQGNQATVHDCLFSSIELVYSTTGKPVPPVTQPEHDGVQATLEQVSVGTWKVSDQNVTDGSCPAGY